MTEQATIDGIRRTFAWNFERPAAFNVLQAPVPGMTYPWEIGGAADWNCPQSTPETEREEELFGGVPRVDLMPADRVFVWMMLRDAQRDEQLDSMEWSAGSSDVQLAPAGASDEGPPKRLSPFTSADGVGQRWQPHLTRFRRVAHLADDSGEIEDKPFYLMVEVFAASEQPDLSGANAIITSLQFEIA